MHHILGTECTLWKRIEEHAHCISNKAKQSAIYQHLSSCEHYNHLVDLLRLQNETFNLKKFSM